MYYGYTDKNIHIWKYVFTSSLCIIPTCWDPCPCCPTPDFEILVLPRCFHIVKWFYWDITTIVLETDWWFSCQRFSALQAIPVLFLPFFVVDVFRSAQYQARVTGSNNDYALIELTECSCHLFMLSIDFSWIAALGIIDANQQQNHSLTDALEVVIASWSS